MTLMKCLMLKMMLCCVTFWGTITMSYRTLTTYTQQITDLLEDLERDIGPTNRERIRFEVNDLLNLIDEEATSTENALEEIIRTAQDAL